MKNVGRNIKSEVKDLDRDSFNDALIKSLESLSNEEFLNFHILATHITEIIKSKKDSYKEQIDEFFEGLQQMKEKGDHNND